MDYLYFKSLADKCILVAITCIKAHEIDLATFYFNAAKGFEKKALDGVIDG